MVIRKTTEEKMFNGKSVNIRYQKMLINGKKWTEWNEN